MKNKLITFGFVSLGISLILFGAGVLVARYTAGTITNEVTTESKELGDFSKIDIESLGDVNIVKGNSNKIAVTASKSYLKNQKTEIRDNTLYLSNTNYKIQIFAFDFAPNIKYEITVKNLTDLNLKGAGNVHVEIMDKKDVNITSEGYGNITIDTIAATNTKISHTGAGNFTVKSLISNNLELNSDGVGNIDLAGIVTKAVFRLNGVGNLDSTKLLSQDVEITKDGTGNADVFANKTLKIKQDGVGNVTYSGNPSVTKENNGVGKINAN